MLLLLNPTLKTTGRFVAGILLFCVSATAPAQEARTQPSNRQSREDYVAYATQHTGDVAAGQQLFENHKQLACKNCHAITGIEKSGPNLDGIADKYPRKEMIKHILDPNAFIQPGYETVSVLTSDGQSLVGRMRLSTKLEVRILDATGKLRSVRRKKIDEILPVATSMMPDNLEQAISTSEFADLIAYLQTLRSGLQTGWSAADAPVEIPILDTPVSFKALHPPKLKFRDPVWIGAIPGKPGQLLVVEHQEAQIHRLDMSASPPTRELFLDLSAEIEFGMNQGLMCIAFHPDFETNRKYYLKYEVREERTVKTTVNERFASDDGLHDAGTASRRLLHQEQPAFNHNGGCLAFGPDGMLYIAFGDGGPQEDPPGYSQNPRIFHGSVLRIDVDQRADGKEYGIPADNPFLESHRKDSTVHPETWAIGFREPWRFSFDSLTGDMWLGDVGQVKYEEVCLVRGGQNHGWNVLEGFAEFSDEYRRVGEQYEPPVFVYPHSFGVSVTGGHVYRGDSASSFYGVYIFGDYESRRVWGLKYEQGHLREIRQIGRSPQHIASFGVDADGELLMVGYEGTIYRIDLSGSRFE